MGHAVSVGALAVAEDRANAVGAVRLTCGREGLTIELCRVASFSASFAPAAVVEEVSFTVPYVAVRGLVRRGRYLHLALDPAVATPYNRFALARFCDDPRTELLGAYATRARARLASIAFPPLLGFLAAAMAPETLVSGALGRASVAVLVAALAWLLMREIVAWVSWGGPSSDAYRAALEVELSRRMGLAPAPVAVDVPIGDLQTILAEPEPSERKRAAIAIGAVAAITCVTLAVLRQSGTSAEGAPKDVDLAVVGVAGATRRLPSSEPASSPATPTSAPGRAEPCLCERAASPLWERGMPVLAVMTSGRKPEGSEVAPRPDAGGVMRWDFDLAVVNGSAAPLEDVKVVVTFARRDADGTRVGVKERGLFYEGDLAPARAVKWRVRGPGTEMRIEADAHGELGGSIPAAPADAFAELSRTAHHRMVRVHAATMLAWLADPRAAEIASTLGFGTPADEAIVAAVRRASAPVIACEVAADGPEGIGVCLFNAGSAMARVTRVAEPASAPTPRGWPLDRMLPVHEGDRVRLEREGGAPIPTELVVTSVQ